MTAFFEARRLTYTYPRGVLAVRGVSLEASRASTTAVIGANGSGKSTLIRMLAGLLAPSSGEITLDSVPLQKWEARARAREIAYMPQTTTVAFPFRAVELVLTGRYPHLTAGRLDSVRDRELAMEALESAGAAHLADRTVTTLSGGEIQMVVLARALAQEPRLLLLDEPSASLDLKHRAELMRTLARLRERRGLSVIMITHDLQLAGSLFDRIVALRCGEVAADGPAEAVLRSEILADVYGEAGVRAQRVGGRTVIWVDA